MFYLADCGFNCSSQITSFFLVGQSPLAPLGHIDLLLIEAQVKPEISFPFLNWTFL
jgi:hypothetical protein